MEAMDVFSTGCIITEIFLEVTLFISRQLFKYWEGEYKIDGTLAVIEDKDVQVRIFALVICQLVQLYFRTLSSKWSAWIRLRDLHLTLCCICREAMFFPSPFIPSYTTMFPPSTNFLPRPWLLIALKRTHRFNLLFPLCLQLQLGARLIRQVPPPWAM